MSLLKQTDANAAIELPVVVAMPAHRALADRLTYTHKLGHALNPNNSGAMQWGTEYRAFHVAAWTEARRVLEPGGVFVLNIKDHIRGGVRRKVTDWHIEALEALGFVWTEHVKVDCPGMRYGQNGSARVDYESVIRFELQEASRT
jgi:hypothetical protein